MLANKMVLNRTQNNKMKHAQGQMPTLEANTPALRDRVERTSGSDLTEWDTDTLGWCDDGNRHHTVLGLDQ